MNGASGFVSCVFLSYVGLHADLLLTFMNKHKSLSNRAFHYLETLYREPLGMNALNVRQHARATRHPAVCHHFCAVLS